MCLVLSQKNKIKPTGNIIEMEPSSTPITPGLNLCQCMKQAARKGSVEWAIKMFGLISRDGLELGIFLSGGIYGC